MPPPLDGLVICVHCGTPMHEYSIHKHGLNYYLYRCIGDNIENCPIREIPAKKLEKLIWTFLSAGLHEPNVSVMYEAITGQKADEFLKWFDTISISALSRNKSGQLFHEIIDNVRISPYQVEIEIKAACFAACPPTARETH